MTDLGFPPKTGAQLGSLKPLFRVQIKNYFTLNFT